MDDALAKVEYLEGLAYGKVDLPYQPGRPFKRARTTEPAVVFTLDGTPPSSSHGSEVAGPSQSPLVGPDEAGSEQGAGAASVDQGAGSPEATLTEDVAVQADFTDEHEDPALDGASEDTAVRTGPSQDSSAKKVRFRGVSFSKTLRGEKEKGSGKKEAFSHLARLLAPSTLKEDTAAQAEPHVDAEERSLVEEFRAERADPTALLVKLAKA